MIWGKEPERNKTRNILPAMANRVIGICGGFFFLLLTWYSMRYTQYIEPQWQEIPQNVPDSAIRNIAVLAAAAGIYGVLLWLEGRLSARLQKRITTITLLLLCLWLGAFGSWWITAADRTPVGDQAYVYGGASYFLGGDYAFLQEGGYCCYYPHQLGFMALLELFFRFVGPLNYFAVQIGNVLTVIGIAILGFCLTEKLAHKMAVTLFYCLPMFACLPLIFYTGWVYGEIPSIFFSMLTAYCLLCYDQKGQKRWLAGMVAAVVLAVLVRKNSLIMLIALCLVSGVYSLQKRDKRLLVAVAVAVAFSFLSYSGIYKMYEIRSGYEINEGVPAMSYLAMGMQEEGGKCGWYTQYCKEVFSQNHFDASAASQVAKQDMKSRIREFLDTPLYAVHFYREKILSQWNAPLYQSVFFSVQYWEGKEPYCDSDIYRLTNVRFGELLQICNRMQFVLYFGMLCYYLFAVKRDSTVLMHMLAVTIIGGFLFSILWEAKARYIFPYYVTMYPLAAMGYWQLFSRLQGLFGKKSMRGTNKVDRQLEKVA